MGYLVTRITLTALTWRHTYWFSVWLYGGISRVCSRKKMGMVCDCVLHALTVPEVICEHVYILCMWLPFSSALFRQLPISLALGWFLMSFIRRYCFLLRCV
eukprot:scpid110664/ scgid16324/ 